MKKFWLFVTAILIVTITVSGHDLYLKLDNFFVNPQERISVKILNGSFETSQSPVAFSRLNDASLVLPNGQILHPGEKDFTLDEKTSYLHLTPKDEGTYIVSISTKKREIGLSNKDFDDYLAEDGIPDILAQRKKVKPPKPSVNEIYSKHVKMIFQVGNNRTDSFQTPIGYPVEIIPQTNPYNLKVGNYFEFLCLKDGKPIANQYVMTGRERGGKLVVGKNIRTNDRGIGRIKIDGAGKWYLKFINMAKINQDLLDYESKWTTLTFEVK